MIRDELPQEPDSDNPDIIKILLKLPNGTRLERRFIKSQSLKVAIHCLTFHPLRWRCEWGDIPLINREGLEERVEDLVLGGVAQTLAVILGHGI